MRIRMIVTDLFPFLKRNNVKSVASFICGPNENDGAAKWTESRIL